MADEPKTTPDANALQAKINELDERAKRFEAMTRDQEKQLERFKNVNLDKLKADSEALEILQRDQAGKNPDDLKKWQESERGKIRSEVQSQLEALAEENKKLKGINRELTVVEKAMEKIGPLFNDDGHVFIKNYVRQSIDRNEKGEFVIKGEDGEARYSPSKPAQYLSLEEWAGEIAGKHPSIAKSTVPRGSGKAGEKFSSAGGITPERYAKMSREDQLRIPVKERGELAQAAMRQIKLTGN